MKLLRFAVLMGVLVVGGTALAQAPPHAVICVPIVYSDGMTPVLAADLTFDAWIVGNEGDVIDETTTGNAVWDDVAGAGAQIECSQFTDVWQAGDVLMVEFTGAGSNYPQAETELFSIVLNDQNPQWADGNGPQGEFILPVELSSFSAEAGPGRVVLTWVTISEAENAGFNIHRSTEENGTYTKLNDELIPGAGTSTVEHTYTYTDEGLTGGLYFYQLEAVSTTGDAQSLGNLEVRPTPTEFALSSGHPNPMANSTEIAFQLPSETRVSLRVYDMAGREVRTLVNENLDAGFYSQNWNGLDANGRSVANGVYFYRMDAGSFNATKKLVVLR
jgi:hypothetical protein